jgi:hypothetical protein
MEVAEEMSMSIDVSRGVSVHGYLTDLYDTPRDVNIRTRFRTSSGNCDKPFFCRASDCSPSLAESPRMVLLL